MNVRNVLGTFAKSLRPLRFQSSTFLLQTGFYKVAKNQFIPNRFSIVDFFQPYYPAQRTFSAGTQCLPVDISQRTQELTADLPEPTCDSDNWDFEKRKSWVIHEIKNLIDISINRKAFKEALEREIFLHTAYASKSIKDLQKAYHFAPSGKTPSWITSRLDLFIDRKKTQKSIEEYRFLPYFYSERWIDINAYMNSYQTRIDSARKTLLSIVDELEKNDLWSDIRPNLSTLSKVRNTLLKHQTEAELAQLVHVNFQSSHFKSWNSIFSTIQDFYRDPCQPKYEANQFFTQSGKLLHEILEPEHANTIYPTFPEEHVNLLFRIERWQIQYDLETDSDAHRHYEGKYRLIGKGFSDDAIKQETLSKMKKAALLGQSDYDDITSKKAYYRIFVLNPANWYDPIPEEIWIDIKHTINESLKSKEMPCLTDKSEKLLKNFLQTKWTKYTLKEKHINLIDFLSCPQDVKIDLIIMLNQIADWGQFNLIFKQPFVLSEFSAMETKNRAKYITLLFSRHGLNALDKKLFTREDSFSLPDDKYNILMSLLNSDGLSISDDDLKLKIQQVFNSRSSGAELNKDASQTKTVSNPSSLSFFQNAWTSLWQGLQLAGQNPYPQLTIRQLGIDESWGVIASQADRCHKVITTKVDPELGIIAKEIVTKAMHLANAWAVDGAISSAINNKNFLDEFSTVIYSWKERLEFDFKSKAINKNKLTDPREDEEMAIYNINLIINKYEREINELESFKEHSHKYTP